MTATPEVSVIIPVHNSQEYVEQAIRSILDQTFRDMEVIVVDDGSTDGSRRIIRSIKDPRLVAIEQENQGLPGALNTAIRSARAALIARSDHDDVALPERIEAQVRYMKDHPEVGLLGTWAVVADERLRPRMALQHPATHALIQYSLLFDSPFVHPSVMFRREVFERVGGYSEDPLVFEDLDLWTRMSGITTMANIPKEMMIYREVSTSISRKPTRTAKLLEQRRRNFEREVPGISPRILDALIHADVEPRRVSLYELKEMRDILYTLIDRYGGSSVERLAMLKDAHARLMNCRTNSRKTMPARYLDALKKRMVLSLFGRM